VENVFRYSMDLHVNVKEDVSASFILCIFLISVSLKVLPMC
jgi:hypothetical protein